MSLVVHACPPGTLAVDTVARISRDQARQLRQLGVGAVFRYATAIKGPELADLTAEGLGVGFVLYSDKSGYQPSATLGAAEAAMGIANLRAIGVPTGASIHIDAEGMGGTVEQKIEHVNAGAAVIAAHDVAGLYVGAGVGLTSRELYSLPQVHGYWKSLSRVVGHDGACAEPECGWYIVQGYPPNLTRAGVQVDVDLVMADYRGRSPLLVWAA